MADPGDQEPTVKSDVEVNQTTATSPVAETNESTKEVESNESVKEPEKNGEAVEQTSTLAKEEDPKSDGNGKSTESKPVDKKSERGSDYKKGSTSHKYNNNSGRGNSHKGKVFEKRKNNKFDPSSIKETDDPVEIRKQVEFYFSDSNLPNDKFLFEAIDGSKNKAVPIETIHSFKRMRRFQPLSAVIAALKESSTLNVVENDTAIQRKTPLPEGTGNTQPEIQKVYENQAMARTVYVKGFGAEKSTTQFDIEAWFSKFGATNQVRLRRTNDSGFKGSVFVEFDSEETAQNFMATDPAPKYNGKSLIIKSKKQYCDEKVDELNSGAKRVEEPDERDWKTRREVDRKRGFPPLHKDGRNGRGHGRDRGGHKGRESRHEGSRNDEARDKKEKDDDKKDETTADNAEEKAVAKETDDSTETKKRDREDDHDSEAPDAKKTAIESEMTGEPQAA